MSAEKQIADNTTPIKCVIEMALLSARATSPKNDLVGFEVGPDMVPILAQGYRIAAAVWQHDNRETLMEYLSMMTASSCSDETFVKAVPLLELPVTLGKVPGIAAITQPRKKGKK